MYAFRSTYAYVFVCVCCVCIYVRGLPAKVCPLWRSLHSLSSSLLAVVFWQVLGTDLLEEYLDAYDLELELEVEQRLGWLGTDRILKNVVCHWPDLSRTGPLLLTREGSSCLLWFNRIRLAWARGLASLLNLAM